MKAKNTPQYKHSKLIYNVFELSSYAKEQQKKDNHIWVETWSKSSFVIKEIVTGTALGWVHLKQERKAFFKVWCTPETWPDFTAELDGSKPSKTGSMRP